MKALKVCRYNFRMWRVNSRFILCVLAVVGMIWYTFSGLTDYARSLGQPLTPFLFPHLVCDMDAFSAILLVYVFLICDVPMRNKQQLFVIQRVGKRTWMSGQLLYVLVTGFLFVLICFLCSWAMVLPGLEWRNEWGAVLKTGAMTLQNTLFAPLAFTESLMKLWKPIPAMLWCFFMTWAVCCFLGELTMAFNLWLGRGIGSLVSASFVMLYILVNSLSREAFFRRLLWISPVSWIDPSMLGYTNMYLPSHGFSVAAILILCAGLGTCLLVTVHCCSLDAEKG